MFKNHIPKSISIIKEEVKHTLKKNKRGCVPPETFFSDSEGVKYITGIIFSLFLKVSSM